MSFADRGRVPALLFATALVALSWTARAADDAAQDAKDTDEQQETTDAPETSDAPAQPEKAPVSAHGSVLVLPFTPIYGDAPQSTGDKLTTLVHDEIVKANEFKAVDLSGGNKSDAAKGVDAGAEKAKSEIAAANALFEKAKTLFEKKKIKPAQDALEKGISQYLANFQGADDFKSLSDAYVLLASTRFLLGNDDGATKALDDLIRIDPSRVVTAPAVSSEIADRHAKERQALFGRSRGDMKIESAPAGAQVMLDGKVIGETPLMARSILLGDHFLRVSKAGAGVFAKKVTVGSNPIPISATLTAEATGPLATVVKSLSHNAVDDAALKAAQKLAADAGADYVLLGAVHADDDNIQAKSYALRVKDGAIAELTGITVDSAMISAGIEILKITGDLSTRVQSDTFTPPPGPLTPFDGVAAPKEGAAALTEVVVTPATVDGQKPAEGEAAGSTTTARPNAGSGRSHRGPVTAQGDQPVAKPPPAVVAPSPDKKKPAQDDQGSALEELERRRQQRKGRVVVPESPTKDEQGMNDEATGTARENGSPDVKLEVPKKDTEASGLTAEQLARLNQAEQAPSSGGKIALWTSVGVVGAAALATGAYFLFFRQTTPTTATANIKWQQ